MTFEIWEKEERTPITITVDLPMLKGEIKLESKFPYNKLKLIDINGNSISSKPATFLSYSEQDKKDIQHLINYEVLYVGQAFGKDGNKKSLDRIVRHETLQEILNDTLNDAPDKEIFIFLGCFNYKNIMMSLPFLDYNEKYNESLEEVFFKNSGFNISKKQLINITEGMLIKYFQSRCSTFAMSNYR